MPSGGISIPSDGVGISWVNFEIPPASGVAISWANLSLPENSFDFSGVYLEPPLRIDLTWNVEPELSYNLYKWSDVIGGWYRLFASDVSSYIDYFVIEGTTYQYKLTTFSNGEESTYFETVSVTIPRETPMSTQSRASIYQGIQMAFEVTPGVIVPANRRITGFSMTQMPVIPVKVVKYQGTKGVSGTQKGQQHTESKFEGAADFNMLTYLANMAYGPATSVVTDMNSVPATTYNWIPSSVNPLPMPSTVSFEEGSTKGAEGFGFGFVSGMDFKWSKEEATISGTIIGQKQTRDFTMTPNILMTISTAATMSATSVAVTTSTSTGTIPAGTYKTAAGKIFVVTAPATITASAATLTTSALAAAIAQYDTAYTIPEIQSMPVDPHTIGVYVSLDGVSWTMLNDGMEGQVNLNALWAAVFHQNDNTGSEAYNTFDRIAELQAAFDWTYTTEEGTEADNFMSDLNNGTRIYLGVKATGLQINASPLTKYLIRLYMPVYVTKPDPGDKTDVVGNTFTFEYAHDPTFGMFNLTIVNQLAFL